VSELVVARYPVPPVVRAANLSAKAGLIMLLALALLFPEASHMRDKAAGLRAVVYPMLAFTIPAIWVLFWRDRATFPWLADFLVTIACFTDILGNRMNLYDTIVWFDDWMHFMNTGMLAAAVVLLTMHRSSAFLGVLERALAVGATGAIAWEIGEYFAFISGSSERRFAYVDTLGDLGLGVLGAITAATIIHKLWTQGKLTAAAPQLERRTKTESVHGYGGT
jgi:hypothetical protein